jgi:hypothetical protein
VAHYRIHPTAQSMDLPAADFMCEQCGKVLGVVRWRYDVRALSLAQAVSRCPELTAMIRQHETDCPKKTEGVP